MIYRKQVRGVGAEVRFAAEVEAHAHEQRFWTRTIPTWTTPRLVHNDPSTLELDFTRVEGQALTWAEGPLLATRLAAAAATVPSQIRIHGDLHPGNVLVAGGVWCVVDWELSRPGEFGEELGALLAHALLAFGRGQLSPGALEQVASPIEALLGTARARGLALQDLGRQTERERAVRDAARVAERVLLISTWSSRWALDRPANGVTL